MCSHVSEGEVCFPAGAVFMCSLSPASARAPAIKVITCFSLSAGTYASKPGKNSVFCRGNSSFLGGVALISLLTKRIWGLLINTGEINMLIWRVGAWVFLPGDVVNTRAKNLKCFRYLGLEKSRPFLQRQISGCYNIDGFCAAIKCCSAVWTLM